MMSEITTAAFLTKGSTVQFRYVLSLYDEALRIKAESKSKKPQELVKLDQWYQKEFPSKIKSRGKDPHIIHDELVSTMKWKLARGKFRPRLKELVTMNSPRVVEQESRKAFRALFKKDDLAAAIQYLCNLKGIGPATASAIVTAAAPDRAAFMADECLAAVPEIEGIDYTLQEYLEMLKHIRQAVQRLGGPEEWNPHQIELALWTHHILLTHRPDMLQDMPDDFAQQEDSLGSTISSDSKELNDDSNSNQGLNQVVLPHEDSNFATESEKGEDSNSADAFIQAVGHVRKNGDRNDLGDDEDEYSNSDMPVAKKAKLDPVDDVDELVVSDVNANANNTTTTATAVPTN